jgi:hypothetical protein
MQKWKWPERWIRMIVWVSIPALERSCGVSNGGRLLFWEAFEHSNSNGGKCSRMVECLFVKRESALVLPLKVGA